MHVHVINRLIRTSSEHFNYFFMNKIIQDATKLKNNCKLRWKAIFFLKGRNLIESNVHKTGLTFDLNGTKCPLQPKDLVPIKEDLIKFVKKITFSKVNNKFQTTFAKDIKEINHRRKLDTAKEQFHHIKKRQRKLFKSANNKVSKPHKKLNWRNK